MTSQIRPDQAWKAKREAYRAAKRAYGAQPVGRRPEVMECLEAWLRCVDSDPRRVKPGKLRSNAHGRPESKNPNPWDEYCRERVQDAVDAIKSPSQAELLLDIAAYRMTHGSMQGWKCFNVAAISPASESGSILIQVPGSMPRIQPDIEAGIDLFNLASQSFAWFKAKVQVAIDEAEPYVRPAPNIEPWEKVS